MKNRVNEPAASAPSPASILCSTAALVEHVNHGGLVKYLFFWGHRPAMPGVVDRACLSQWFEAAFELDGVLCPTAEHGMMAAKARLFADHATLARIIKAPNPGAVKALGREVQGFDEAVWAAHRSAIVVAVNQAKFSQNPGLGAFLAGTGPRILVEASPVDRIWGIGLAADDPRADNPNAWRGLNLLGFALMQVRAALREARPA